MEDKPIPSSWKDASGDRCHLVGLIDDEGESVCVYRKWQNAKKRWQYTAEPSHLTQYSLKMMESMS